MNDGFFYNYWNAAWAMVQGLNKSKGAVGVALQRALPRIKPAFQVANNGVLRLDSRRQAIQDQYPLQIAQGRREAGGDPRGLRAERRPDVRRLLRPEQEGAGAQLSPRA